MSIIPALWEAKTGGSPEVKISRSAWPIWWCMPIIPATWKDEVGESLEPRRQRLQ